MSAQTAADYRAKAAALLEKAESAVAPERAHLVVIADRWIKLAEDLGWHEAQGNNHTHEEHK